MNITGGLENINSFKFQVGRHMDIWHPTWGSLISLFTMTTKLETLLFERICYSKMLFIQQFSRWGSRLCQLVLRKYYISVSYRTYVGISWSIPVWADELSLVLGVLVGRPAHVSVRQCGRGRGRRHLALCVVELFFMVTLSFFLWPANSIRK